MKLLFSAGFVKVGRVAYQVFGIPVLILTLSANPTLANASNVNHDSLFEELSVLEGVQISPAILANAPLDTIEGKLYCYQQARLALESAVAAQNEAYAAYQSVAIMDDIDIKDGGHDTAQIAAGEAYNLLQRQAEASQDVAQTALGDLTGGRALSYVAMTELHALLGL
jgi:hypothetical protein